MNKDEAKKLVGKKIYSLKYFQTGTVKRVTSKHIWISFTFNFWSLSHKFDEVEKIQDTS